MSEEIEQLNVVLDNANFLLSKNMEMNKDLTERINKAIEYCDRYLQLNLELFDSYELLKKLKEILGDKENE